jgi:hypothetical protein
MIAISHNTHDKQNVMKFPEIIVSKPVPPKKHNENRSNGLNVCCLCSKVNAITSPNVREALTSGTVSESISNLNPLRKIDCGSQLEIVISDGKNCVNTIVAIQAMKKEVSVRIQIVLICLFFKTQINEENPKRMIAGNPATGTP